MIRLINLCPHPIRIRLSASALAKPDATDLVFPSLGSARCATFSEPYDGITDSILGTVPVRRVSYGETTGLPAAEPGTYYIVSLLVLQRHRERRDLLSMASGPSDGVIRDAQGQVYAVRAIAVEAP